MLDFQITEFWNWFAKNSNGFDPSNFDKGLMKELDHKIVNWELSWEIGPGFTKEYSLTLSPNGNINLLAQTNNIIDQAPMLDAWEFYSSKQPKQNWQRAKLIDKGLEFEATDWTYILLQYPDDKVEILVKADNLKSLDKNSKEIAVDLILTNLLGEQIKMTQLDFIDIVNDFENENEITEIQFLPKHLKEIKKGS
ncbi:hypothetical protein [Ferruginibacter sp. SUN106]|uniref:hypothetical protein n=1 Tax=Ferruginibacter sp. SUN106 TaxID=2978348 RepID=UPI003D36999A